MKDLYALSYMAAKICGLGKSSTSGHKERKGRSVELHTKGNMKHSRLSVSQVLTFVNFSHLGETFVTRAHVLISCVFNVFLSRLWQMMVLLGVKMTSIFPFEMAIDYSFDDTSDIGKSRNFRRGEHVHPTSQCKADQASQFPEVFQARQGYESVEDR